jgi:RNA 3'-terminal phosphate cyclase (ATP)
VTGGTDVKWAPTLDHHRRVKLPLVRRAGLDAETAVGRRGFYPAGGGSVTASLSPSTPSRLELDARGRLRSVVVRSVAAEGLSSADVAERQAGAAVEFLESLGLSVHVGSAVEYVGSDSPGSAVLVRAVYGETIAGFDALGERGLPAEEVGRAAAEGFGRFAAGAAAVDEHTADQLVLPLAVAGGRVTIPRVTDHVASNVDLVRAFGAAVRLTDDGDGPPRIVSESGFGRR